jgi:hypothetical protein
MVIETVPSSLSETSKTFGTGTVIFDATNFIVSASSGLIVLPDLIALSCTRMTRRLKRVCNTCSASGKLEASVMVGSDRVDRVDGLLTEKTEVDEGADSTRWYCGDGADGLR